MLHRYVLVCRWLLTLLLGALAARPGGAQTLASRVYTLADGLPQSTVYALAQDARGQLWVGTQGGASWFDGRRFQTLDTRPGPPDNHVTALTAGRGGAMWLGHNYGAVSAISAAGRGRAVGPKHWHAAGTVRQLLPAGPGGAPLWVATTGDGLYRLNSATNPIELHHSAASGLPADSVNQLCWGPRGAAVLHAATRWPLPTADLPTEVRKQVVNSLFRVNDQRFWCATNAGLVQLTRPAPGAPWQARRFTAQDGLCANQVLRVLQDRMGRVWLLTAAGIGQLEQGQVRCFRGMSPLRDLSASDILEDREGNVWLVRDDGLLRHVPGERFALFGAADGLPEPNVQSILPRADGTYWVGTRAGLYVLQPEAPAGRRTISCWLWECPPPASTAAKAGPCCGRRWWRWAAATVRATPRRTPRRPCTLLSGWALKWPPTPKCRPGRLPCPPGAWCAPPVRSEAARHWLERPRFASTGRLGRREFIVTPHLNFRYLP